MTSSTSASSYSSFIYLYATKKKICLGLKNSNEKTPSEAQFLKKQKKSIIPRDLSEQIYNKKAYIFMGSKWSDLSRNIQNDIYICINYLFDF